MIDLQPATQRIAHLASSITDEQLARPTPCPDLSVGDLLDHLSMFAVVFVGGARKEGPAKPPPPSGANLPTGWREELATRLIALADAWSDPQAWEGVTHAGSVEMPAELVGEVAIDELVIHGWDLAVATGQPYAAGDDEVAAARHFVESFEVPRDGSLFGPVVAADDTASPLDQLLGLTGRDPGWRPPG